MSNSQLKAMVAGFSKGSSKKDLENILNNLKPEQVVNILEDLKVGTSDQR